MAIWSHVEGAESDPPFGWMRHLVFKIQRENEPSARGWWRWWKPKRTRLLGRQEESCPSFSPARRDASPRDGRAAERLSWQPRGLGSGLTHWQVLPSQSSPSFSCKTWKGGGNESLRWGAEPGDFAAMK